MTKKSRPSKESEHIVQFYEDERFLVESVAGFLGSALGAGMGGIAIVTPPHRAALAKQLRLRGFDLDALSAQRRYVAVDAQATLDQIMVDGLPDESRFMRVVGALVREAMKKSSGLRAFGEMVALLWAEKNAAAAIRLEELWNKLGRRQSFSLLCAYPLQGFRDAAAGNHFANICCKHARVIPSEDYFARKEDDEKLRMVASLQQKAAALEGEIGRGKQIEAQSLRRADFLQAIVDNTPECVKVVAPDGTLLSMNSSGLAMVGADAPGQVVGRTVFDLIAPEDRDVFRAIHERVCAGHKQEFKYQIIGLKDARRTVESYGIPIRDPDTGEIVHLGVTRDVTERDRGEETRRRLAAIIESSNDAIISKDLDGTITSWNKSAERLFGYTTAEILGQPVTVLMPPDRIDEESTILERIRKGERIDHYETVRRHKDGRIIDVSLTVSPVKDSSGRVIGASKIVRDITERKETERATQLLGAIVESSEDAIASKDLNGRIMTWNQGAERLFGYTAQEAVGQHITLIIPPERQGEEPGILDRIRRGEKVERFETVRRRKDGSLVHVSLTVSPVRNAKGEVIGASKIARDITDKVRSQELLERMVTERTAQLHDAVSELEAFSYSVAHDMRAPLRTMNSYARFLEQDFGESLPREARDFVRRISAGAERLDALITDVLNYSKVSRGEMPLERVDVEKLAREILESYPDLRESNATILVQTPIPPVIANKAALTQCISNLLSNAVKFVARGTTPQVRVRAEKFDGRVRLWVEDNGIGISKEGRQRIFRMFQRLNPAGEFEGTGIGLTIVRKAVERMGGSVGVESEPGAGSQFWVELKRAN